MECSHYTYKHNVVQHYSYTWNVAADVLVETMDTIVNFREGCGRLQRVPACPEVTLHLFIGPIKKANTNLTPYSSAAWLI